MENMALDKFRLCDKHWAYDDKYECLITDILNENLDVNLLNKFVHLESNGKHFVYIDTEPFIETKNNIKVRSYSVRYPGLTIAEIIFEDETDIFIDIEFYDRHGEGKYIVTEKGMKIVKSMINNVIVLNIIEPVSVIKAPTSSNEIGTYTGVTPKVRNSINEVMLPDYKKRHVTKYRRTLPEFGKCISCKSKVEISTLKDSLCKDCRC
jgi:hypothetical protein